MTRLLSIGFESGVVADDIDAKNGILTIVTTIVRTGNYALKIDNINSYANFNFPTGALTEFYLGIGYYQENNASLFKFMDLDSHVVAQITVLATGALRLTCNGVTSDSELTYALGEWHFLEVHFLFDGTSGIFETKVDGSAGPSISGNTSQSTYLAPRLLQVNTTASSSMIYVDDFVLNDIDGGANNSWPGRAKLYPIRPNAAGDVTQLTRGGTNSGSNYGQVDEAPASATDYVYSDVADQYDLYNLTTVTLPDGYEIANVIVVNDAYLDSGSGQLTGVIKSGTEAQGVDHILTNTAHCYSDAFPEKPGGGAWTQADIDALQAGPKVR